MTQTKPNVMLLIAFLFSIVIPFLSFPLKRTGSSSLGHIENEGGKCDVENHHRKFSSWLCDSEQESHFLINKMGGYCLKLDQ